MFFKLKKAWELLQFTSKTLQSELAVLRHSCEIKEKTEYFVVRSLRNPHFHWGNFLIFKQAPQKNDLPKWEEYFCLEFPEFIHQHRAFTWIHGEELPADCKITEYLIEKTVCLTTKDVQPVKQIHPDITIRKVQTEQEWLELEQKQAERIKPEDRDPSFLSFNKQKFKDYKAIVDKDLGDWFIADLGGEWVGDLGLFHSEGMACYQNVTTYPGFEGLGIAHALVYGSAQYAIAHYPVKELVIVAEENSRAQKIYQNLGFQVVERRTNLYRSYH